MLEVLLVPVPTVPASPSSSCAGGTPPAHTGQLTSRMRITHDYATGGA
ncbi:hypothetical protein HMPREF9344_00653 [Cutibacterium acnes HL097PA1]|nr:hypothetical protein HMPREF9344_00653 [Cutibacterium acnes HL097PA1]